MRKKSRSFFIKRPWATFGGHPVFALELSDIPVIVLLIRRDGRADSQYVQKDVFGLNIDWTARTGVSSKHSELVQSMVDFHSILTFTLPSGLTNDRLHLLIVNK